MAYPVFVNFASITYARTKMSKGICPLCNKPHNRSKTGLCPTCYGRAYYQTEAGKKVRKRNNREWNKRNREKRQLMLKRRYQKDSTTNIMLLVERKEDT